jgi:hypothetical protein
MADIRCSNCGRNNPDFLDVCQFCQNPLKPESMVHPGESPTKKNTGELEPILPEWLRDVRQQARESAEEEATQAATQPKIEKEEPPDLLAGLAVQASSDEEDIPDWLVGLSPVEEKTSSEAESPSDFFAQFEKSEPPPAAETTQEETPAWMAGEAAGTPSSEQKDELTDWFAATSAEPVEPFSFDVLQDEKDVPGDFGFFASQAPEPAASQEPEDLSWLRDLEASSKQSAVPPEEPSPTLPPSSQEDLSWLSTLGGTPEPSVEEPAPALPPSSQEDLSWLSTLGGTSEPSVEEPAPTLPPSSPEDLGWLSTLGDTSGPFVEEPASVLPTSSDEDLSWLSTLGGTPEPSVEEPASALPSSSDEDMSWLRNLGIPEQTPAADGPSVQPFAQQDDLDWLKSLDGQDETAPEEQPQLSPRRTAPLGENTGDQTMPDWLRSAVEGPSMPPPGAASLDWFASHDEHVDQLPTLSAPESLDQTQEQPASVDSIFDIPSGEPAPISSQDVDSLFSVEMPDWLSGEPEATGETPASTESAAPFVKEGDALAPVDLPSWVQAMRPVESVIDEASATDEDQTTEKEGPLAGFRGVIPSAPIGSLRRPKPISMKLQATNEQQAGAALLEQILAGETTARAIKSAPLVASQRMLRLALTGLFLVVLLITIWFGSQAMPVPNALPAGLVRLSNVVAGIPENSPVLVVVDYEPSLAGELEAVSGPLLDQMVSARRPVFTFLSTSPTGSALVERLMTNTGINKPVPAGFGYQSGGQYFNIGFLPGGSAGVLGFLENPKMAMPAVNVNNFSDFSAVVVLTDHAESSRVWVEQLENFKQVDPALANQSLLIVASAQTGPLLQPYVSSGQVDGMLSGLSDAAKYEAVNNSRPGIARSYWDAFGVGLMMAIALIVFGSLWSLLTKLRIQRAETEGG